MAEQFGNPTTQEVLSQITEEQDLLVGSARTSADHRNALLFRLGRMMTANQDPRMVKANAINTVLGKSLAISREEGEPALDFEIRKGRDLYSRLIDVDQTSAVEVAKSVLELEQERTQQARLKEQDARNEEQHTAQMQSYKESAALNNAEGIRYAYDPKTGASVPGLWSHVNDLTSVVDQAEWQSRGLIPVDRQQLFSLSGQAGDSEAHRGILNNSGIQAHLETASNYVGQAILGKEIISGM